MRCRIGRRPRASVAGVQQRSTPDGDEAIRVFRALSDPTRYQIVKILERRGEVACGEFGRTFDLSAPALSHHFRILRDSGLIVLRKDGSYHHFRLDRRLLARFVRLPPRGGRVAPRRSVAQRTDQLERRPPAKR